MSIRKIVVVLPLGVSWVHILFSVPTWEAYTRDESQVIDLGNHTTVGVVESITMLRVVSCKG